MADALKNQTGQQGAVLLSVEAGFGFKTASKEQNQNYRQSRESSLKAGGDINIRSREGDITVQGSNITAGDTIRLDSARDIRLLSAQDSQHQDGKNRNAGVQVGVGVSVGAQTGVYIYAEAAYGKGKNRSDSQTHQNTLLQSDKLQLSSKGNTVLNGAQAHARRIDADVGGTLYIESPHSPAYAQAYQEARSWGIGGSKSRALSAAETLITGALGGQGDLQLAANTLAPYAAAAIGKRFGHGEHKNEAAQAIGHFMLGAALAYANGADPLAGGSAAVAAERAAEYLAKQYDDGKTAIDPITGKFNPNLLPEHIKEEIKAQTGALASVVGAAGGSLNGTNSSNGALFDAQVAGTVGQNAVENNAAGNNTSAVTRMQSRAATLENSVYAMDFFGLLGNVPAIAAEAQKVSRARKDHWNEEARKYLLKEHGINVPLIEVMENVNGVGVIRQDTERNYKNLRAILDKVNRLKNIPPPTTATPTNRGRIGSKPIGNGISLDAPKSQQKTVDKIKQGLDKDGKLTEQVVNAWAKEMGWRVIPGGKYGSNNGFDHVFVTPTGQVVLGDSKQIETFAKFLFPRQPKSN